MLTRTRAALALIAGGLLALGAPLAAMAEDPISLGSDDIVDTAGVLGSGDVDAIRTAFDSLYEQGDIQFVVVYVSAFTGATNAQEWADVTAIDNGLGARDVLLAVAVDERQYALSIDQDFPLNDAAIDDAERAIETELRASNWAQAAIAGAQAFETAVAPPVPLPGPTSVPGSEGSGGGIPILPIVGGIAVVGVGAYVVSRIRKRSKGGDATADPATLSPQQLMTRAGSLLVQLDDSLKTSEQELGFAVAQFGDSATAEFQSTLETARTKVAEAFAIKQKLDDAHPEPPEEQRTLATRIITLCEEADAALDSQADAFDALRELEKNAPAALEQLDADLARTRETAASSAAALTALTGKYAPSALASIAENPAQAAKLIDYATAASERARTALASGATSEAAIAVREAQAAVGQAGQLFTAIDSLGADLSTASTSLEALIREVTSDITEAEALPRDGNATELGAAIESARAALRAAEAARQDPVAAAAQLGRANATLDTVFAGVRDAQAQAARARAQLDPAIAAARAQIHSASDFIATRRGGIGEPARTRVAEADRLLAQAIALATSDPVTALAHAQQANELGASAFQLARNDVDRYSSAVDYGGSGWQRGTDGADLGGLLGGIVGGMVGSSLGGRGSGGGSWASSRGSRTGSFGGSSRSTRRSSGGGSRGRSRSGRF